MSMMPQPMTMIMTTSHDIRATMTTGHGAHHPHRPPPVSRTLAPLTLGRWQINEMNKTKFDNQYPKGLSGVGSSPRNAPIARQNHCLAWSEPWTPYPSRRTLFLLFLRRCLSAPSPCLFSLVTFAFSGLASCYCVGLLRTSHDAHLFINAARHWQLCLFDFAGVASASAAVAVSAIVSFPFVSFCFTSLSRFCHLQFLISPGLHMSYVVNSRK